jgi:hypothetical protein
MSAEQRKLGVVEREQAIFRYLREGAGEEQRTATIREIHDYLTGTGTETAQGDLVRDTVTVQAYHKLISRLVLDGRLAEAGDPGSDAQRYRLAPAMHADTALTLDDIDLIAAGRQPTQAIAMLIDARQYVGGNQKTVLRNAAVQLQKVDPRALVRDMIAWKASHYNVQVAEWREYGKDDEKHRRLIEAARRELEKICYGRLGLSADAVCVPPAPSVSGEPEGFGPAVVHVDALDRELAVRVYGDTAVQHVPVVNPETPPDWSNVAVAGSDGSTYPSVMSIDTARAHVDDGSSEVVTFNNSIVYLHLEGLNKERHPTPLYSVPITRSAIDSPDNAGMVMASFMYRDQYLEDGEYEHMVKCATDVVQWRADQKVFIGDAPALHGDGRHLPAPRVHLRDGTVTLQEREVNHYQRNDAYGEMVRSGVRLSWQILSHIGTRKQPPVFAGAVKASQLELFSTIINWFIRYGHEASGVDPIDPSWDISRASMLADNELVTMLLAPLVPERGEGYFCTFAVARPFHSLLTEFFRRYQKEKKGIWEAYLRKRQQDHLADPAKDSYWKTVDAIEDDPYVRMCEEADYVMFYIGHSDKDPLPLAPRYEFLESLRFKDPEEAAARVRRNIRLLVAALDHTGFQVDLDHNFLTGKRLVKIVPRVVYQAHEFCKSLGRQLEAELKSAVVAYLHRIGKARRASDDAFNLRPRSAEAYFAEQDRLRGSQSRELGDGGQDEGGDG